MTTPTVGFKSTNHPLEASSSPIPSSPMATLKNVTTPPTPTSVTTQSSTTISERSDDLILHPQGRQRPGEPLCPIYKAYGICRLRKGCVFHHPAELPPMEESKKRKRENKPKIFNFRAFTHEERLAHVKRIKETDGFHVGYVPPGSRMAGMLCPLPLSECGSRHKDAAKLAIKCYNEEHDTAYKFVKLIRVNMMSVAGVLYYITFQAKDGKPGSRLQNFQTRVYKCVGKTEVQLCRLEQKKSTLSEGPGETSQQQGQS